MTVITKPLTDKKSNQLKEPLVENVGVQSAISNQDVESATSTPKYIILGARARRITTSRTLCLLITAFFVMSMSLIGGVCVYRQFTRQQFQRFHGWCKIPYGTGKYVGNRDYQSHQESIFPDSNLFENGVERSQTEFGEPVRNSFRQEFELDLENENFETIEVPNFVNVRSAKFVHDFSVNKTGIVDLSDQRCFVMTLNRQRVFPPRKMFNIINQMLRELYQADTEVVRETMEVVLPPIRDFDDIGSFIQKQCKNCTTYMIRKRKEGIVKRSASANEPVFAEFAGMKISELHIDTSVADEYEKSELSKA